MPKVTKRKVPQESSEGEDFGNDDFSNFNNSSDDEFDSEPETMAEDPWKPIVISGNNKNEYVEGLKMCNLKIEEQRKEIRDLKMENANLRRKHHHDKTSIKGKKTDATEKSADDRISLLARKFCVMNEIFVPEAAFLTTNPGFDPMDSDRYTSEDFIRKGIIAELYEGVPKDLHVRMQGSEAFRDTFLRMLNQMRRAIIHQLKQETGAKIFPTLAKYADILMKERITHQAFKSALLFPGDDNVTKIAPILFEDGKRNMNKMFRCKHLALMLRSIFFGPSSLNNDGRKPNSPKTNGKLWGISQVTPGAIAAVSVFAIYLHSCDDQFRPIGPKSQINYQKIFNQLKEIIIRNSATPPYQKLFAWFNRIIFNWSGSDAKGINSDIDTDSGVEEAILQMDGLYLDDDDNNPPANVDTGGLEPSQENELDLPTISIQNELDLPTVPNLPIQNAPNPVVPIQGPSTLPIETPNLIEIAPQDDNRRHGRSQRVPTKKKKVDDELSPSQPRRSGRRV